MRTFETVTENVCVGFEESVFVQIFENIHVESRRSLYVDVVFEHLFHHEREMRRLGAVAIVVVSLIIDLSHSYIECTAGTLYVLSYLGQIGYAERCAILFDDVH